MPIVIDMLNDHDAVEKLRAAVRALPTAATPSMRVQIERVRIMPLETVKADLIQYGTGTSDECFRTQAAMRSRLATIREARIKAGWSL